MAIEELRLTRVQTHLVQTARVAGEALRIVQRGGPPEIPLKEEGRTLIIRRADVIPVTYLDGVYGAGGSTTPRPRDGRVPGDMIVQLLEGGIPVATLHRRHRRAVVRDGQPDELFVDFAAEPPVKRSDPGDIPFKYPDLVWNRIDTLSRLYSALTEAAEAMSIGSRDAKHPRDEAALAAVRMPLGPIKDIWTRASWRLPE